MKQSFPWIILAVVGCENVVGAPEEIPDWAAASRLAPEAELDPCAEPSVSETAPRLLTRYELDNVLHDLFGTAGSPSNFLPGENSVAGFVTDSDAHRASSVLVESMVDLSRRVADETVMRELSAIAPCATPSDLIDCGRRFVAEQGRRIFRRPLTDEERAVFERLFAQSVPSEGYAGTVSLVLQAMLQSPQFLYRLETAPERESLDGYAIASRMSFVLWRSTPDAQLLSAAADGSLVTSEGIRAELTRMREDPKHRRLYRDFGRQWLGLDRLEGFARDALSDADELRAREALEESILRHVERGFEEGFEAMMTSPELALTGVEDLYDPRAPRAGLITHPALLALLSTPYGSSPVRRGVYVREHLFCEPLPAPPANLSIDPPPPDPNATTRERFAQHTANAGCAACHVRIDPIGFGLEAYDELGRYREWENGARVDTTGEIVGTEDPVLRGEFDGAVELASRLAQSTQVRACVASEFYRFAMGGAAGTEERCSAHRVARALVETGSFDAMIETLITSDAFRLRRSESPPNDGDSIDPSWQEMPQLSVDTAPVLSVDPPEGGRLTGWADDVDAPEVPLRVEVYAAAPMGVGRYVGATQTDLDRPDAPPGRGFELSLTEVQRGEAIFPVVFDPLSGEAVIAEEIEWR